MRETFELINFITIQYACFVVAPLGGLFIKKSSNPLAKLCANVFLSNLLSLYFFLAQITLESHKISIYRDTTFHSL